MQRYLFSFISIILSLILSASAVIADDSVGVLPGALSVSPGGGATYQIPVQVPPGINGVQPEVALTYNSQAGNGLLGIGWSLSASSAITRCATTLEQDGLVDGVDFDSNDRFCFNGARLVLVSGIQGGAESVYKTESDSQIKVIARQSSGIGPAYFEVFKPNGMVEVYGYTADSKVYQNGSYNIAEWRLSLEQDRSGNKASYTYIVDSVQYTHYLSKIDYNGYSIEFVYEARSDISSGFIAPNTKLAMDKRLSSVLVKAGATLTFKYVIGYSSNTVSTVSSISQCSNLMPALKPILR